MNGLDQEEMSLPPLNKSITSFQSNFFQIEKFFHVQITSHDLSVFLLLGSSTQKNIFINFAI